MMRHKRNVQRTAFWGAILMTAIFVDKGKVVAGKSQWSRWLNSDSPAEGQGDDETVEKVYLSLGLPCRPEDVSAVQCRRASSMGSPTDPFHHQTYHQGNVLQVPCNTSGLLCRHVDQAPAATGSPDHHHTLCADYEIRVQCYGRGSDDHHEASSNDITSHSAFIASVAGGSVVLPLVVVLIFRLRKSKRERGQQRHQGTQGAAENSTRAQDEVEAQATDVDAPPSYDALFARSEPVSTISDGSVGMGEGVDDQRRSSTDRLISGDGYIGRGRINHGLASIASSSLDVSSAESVEAPSSASSESVLPNSRLGDNHLRVTTPTRLAATSSGAGLRRISSASSASSASSTHPLLTHGLSESEVTHNDPPPAYDWPGHNHVTVVMPAGRNEASPEESSNHSPVSTESPPSTIDTNGQPSSSNGEPQRRRFLGMHLSIFDLMAVIYPDPAATPPPTYDDALKILGVPQQTEVQVS